MYVCFCRISVVILVVVAIVGYGRADVSGSPAWTSARCGEYRPVPVCGRCRRRGDDLVGQVGLGEDGRGEAGGLGWLAEPAGGHLPRRWAGSPGSILVSAASAGASALTVTPVAASREARKWVSCAQPGLGRRMMRADDAAGERGRPGVSKIRPDPGSRMEPAARWASRNGAHRFTASI